MRQARTLVDLLLVGGAALALAACSSSSAGLTTSSFLPGSKPTPVDEANERAIQVGATSARAGRCGYNFDSARLKAAYLAHETAQGGTAEQVGKLEKKYDQTQQALAKAIAADEDYCDDKQTATIKGDLGRHLAGDFSSVKKAGPGVYDWLTAGSSGTKPLDREALFDPMAARK